MDIYCGKCGEPVAIDYLHDVADDEGLTFAQVRANFQREGCTAIFARCSETNTDTDSRYGLTRGEAASALYDILGDDIDGAASMLEDMFG